MFDLAVFEKRVENVLAQCPRYGIETSDVVSQKKLDRQNLPEIVLFRARLNFPSGRILEVLDVHAWKNRRHTRNAKFRYMESDKVMIFQVDTHGVSVDYDECPHIHRGPREDVRFSQGNPQIAHLDLREFDLSNMWELVMDYEESEKLPWRDQS